MPGSWYKRCGTANVFLCVEPLTGRTLIEATERRTAIDFARFVGDLCDGPYRKAKKYASVTRSPEQGATRR